MKKLENVHSNTRKTRQELREEKSKRGIKGLVTPQFFAGILGRKLFDLIFEWGKSNWPF